MKSGQTKPHPQQTTGPGIDNAGLELNEQVLLDQAGAEKEASVRLTAPSDLPTLEAMYELGVQHHEQGKVAAAEKLLTQASKGYEKTCGLHDEKTLDALEYLAITYRKMDKLNEAESTHSRVLEARKVVFGADHPTTLVAMNRLGMVYRAQGRLDEAERICKKVCETFDQTLGPEHESTLRAWVSRGNLAIARRDFSNAEVIYSTTLDRYRAVLGRDHPSSQQVASNLAAAYIHQEKYPKAEGILVELVGQIEKGHGLKSARAMPALLNLATVYTDQGKYTESNETLATALEICGEIYGPNHTRSLNIMKRIAGIAERQGNFIQAEELLQKALKSSLGDCSGKQYQAVTDTMVSLAGVLKQQGKLHEAQQVQQQLYEAYQSKLGAQSECTIRALHEVGELHLGQMKFAEAETVFEKSTRLWESSFGAHDERTLYSLMSRCFARAGLKANKLQVVETDIWRLFEKLDTTPSLQSTRAALPFHDLSKEYLSKSQLNDAERLAVKAHQITHRLSGRANDMTLLFSLNVDRIQRQLAMDHYHDKEPPLQDTADTESLIIQFEGLLEKILMRSNPNPAPQLAWLGKLYLDKWLRTSHIPDLQRAIDKLETAQLTSTGEDKAGHPEWLVDLARSYHWRFRTHDTLEDLHKAIETLEEALKLDIEHSHTRAEYLNRLSEMHIDLHERESELEALNRAIQLRQKAVDLTPPHHRKRGPYVTRQGMALFLRYQHIGALEDLHSAFGPVKEALSVIPKTDSMWSLCCSIHAQLLQERFQHSGEIQDLEGAVYHAKNALGTASQESSVLLDMLARQLEYRYLALGKREDLSQSIQAAEKAVQICEPTDRYRADYAARLGHLLLERFDVTAHQEDLDLAIAQLETGRDAPKTNKAAEARCFSGLASAFMLRYDQTRDQAYLEAAIDNGKLALDRLPDSFVRKVDVMNNLATYLTERYRVRKMPDDIDEALKYAETVLSLRPPGHMYYPGNLNNLANIFEARFDETGDINDLKLAIETGEKALSLTPPDHPGRVGYSFNLGGTYFTRFERQHEQKDLFAAVKHFINGWKQTNAPPFDRVKAGQQAIYRLIDLGRLDEATTIAMQVVDLLPQLTSRSLRTADQQYVVRKFSGIARTACSLLLHAGRLHEAVEYLERGRTVILNLLMNSRSNISSLESAYPEHAARFQQLQDKINKVFQQGETQASLQGRLALVSDFNKCIEEIRLLPGYDRFLLGPTIESMKSGAKDGFIVVVNISLLRTDAIIISERTVENIELSGLSHSKTAEWLEKDSTSRRKSKSRSQQKLNNEQYTDLLHWLWVTGVKPILDYIKSQQHQPPSSDALPRIYWIGCGIASLLPFHAAQDRISRSTENTFAYAISSYSASIQTLFQARSQSTAEGAILKTRPDLLMVGMPTTRGHASLSGVEDEIEEIEQTTAASFSVQTLLHPRPAQVMAKLGACDLVHLACHAVSDMKNPLNSHLLLQEEDDKEQGGQLTVETILKADLKLARIAYLSACSTAENKAPKLLDEVIHLSSAFQVAGFAHVLGTMWPAKDQISRDVAIGFYRYLTKFLASGAAVRDYGRAVAEAFHFAVTDVRLEWSDEPLFWAQFVHFGG